MRVQNYELEDEILASGPSTFFRARNVILRNAVIVRRLALDPERREDARLTFYREMRHAADLAHPHIQRPLDVMEADGFLWSVHENRRLYSSDQLVRENGPLTVSEVARLGVQASDALAYMHGRGFVHGKIAPRWVLVDDHGNATLTNLVKSADLAAGIWPLRAQVLGLGPFSAPEEFGGQRPAPEGDLYGLAATIAFWLTGRYPRGGDTLEEATERAKDRAPVMSLGDARPDLAPGLLAALDAALEPEPRARRGNVAALGSLLAELQRRHAAEIPGGFDPGAVLDPAGPSGPVQLLGRHGSGAFGVVFRARTRSDSRVIAVKALKPEHRDDSEARERFLREARALQKVQHPNVVRILGVGEERGTPYVVMEFVPGPDLGTLLTREGILPPLRAARLAAGVARGLEAIHRDGIVHRDLKPHNILVAPEDRPVIADFGVARAMTQPRMTMTGQLVGSPAYMAPEQFEDSPSTPAVDLYALGAILFETLTGRIPFSGEGTLLTIRAIRESPPPPLPDGVPRPLAGITHRLLAKEPGQRYARAAVVASDLEAFVSRAAAGVA
jgi:serine/threonine protein kinase